MPHCLRQSTGTFAPPTTAAPQSNLATLVAQKNARGLALPQTSIGAFKKPIGFDDVERLQETYEMS